MNWKVRGNALGSHGRTDRPCPERAGDREDGQDDGNPTQ
jgi:hypothetical protein